MAALNKRVRDYNLNCPVFAQMLFFDPVEEARSEFVLCVYSILTDLLAANARFLQFVFCSFLVQFPISVECSLRISCYRRERVPL